MLYLSLAIMFVAAVFAIKPVEIKFTKTLIVKEQGQEPAVYVRADSDPELTEEDLKEARENAPPTTDDLVEALNQAIHGFSKGDEAPWQ